MTEYVFKNEPDSAITLSVAIGTGNTTLYLTTGDGSKLPSVGAGQQFDICVSQGANYEWMKVTGRSSDTLTVTRSSSPKSFTAGASIDHRLHEDALNNFLQKGTERIVAENPDGDLVPDYNGEEVYNSVTGVFWKHCTGTTWKAMNL
jgi:hypothetical protein